MHRRVALIAAIGLYIGHFLPATRSATDPTSTNTSPARSTAAITGPHHRTIDSVILITNANGTVRSTVQRSVLLETGMHYQESGRWLPSVERIEPDNSGAIANKGPHKVRFAANARSEGALQVITPDGINLRSHVLGIVLTDTVSGLSAWLSETKDSSAEILPPNQLIYRDAFRDIRADIVYTYTKSGLRQDVILREQLPISPTDLGLTPTNTVIVAVTEFVRPPTPIITSPNPTTPASQRDDQSISFGEMQMKVGHAFLDGIPEAQNSSPRGTDNLRVPVQKEWKKIGTRMVLAESVSLTALSPLLDRLPKTASTKKPGKRASLHTPLPQLPDPTQTQDAPAILASTDTQQRRPGVVLDFDLTTSQRDFTFFGDTTYEVQGEIQLSGTTTFQPGTTIKFGKGYPSIGIHGPVNCPRQGQAPAQFIAIDAEPRSFASTLPAPSGYYARRALWIYYPTTTIRLDNLVFKNCQEAIVFDANPGTTLRHTVANSRFENCQTAIRSNGAEVSLQNVAHCRVPAPLVTLGGNFFGSSPLIDAYCDTPPANLAPNIQLATPPALATYTAPATITLHANASDPDNGLSHVEFLVDGQLLGNSGSPPFSMPVQLVQPGFHSLSAVAIDASGTRVPTPGRLVLIQPSSTTNTAPNKLLNINFGGNIAAIYGKAGPAAIGLTPLDHWNDILHNQPGPVPLLWSTGANSPAVAEIQNAPGIYGYPAWDPMYKVYLYSTSDIEIRLSGIPTGTYDLLLYGHGAAPDQNSTFEVTAGSRPLGQRQTLVDPAFDSPGWLENRQFVQFPNITLNGLEPLLIRVSAGATPYRIINGLQLLAKPQPNQPPNVAITTPAGGAVAKAGGSITVEATASDADGTIERVEFFANGGFLGQATLPPYQFTWNPLPTGAYNLLARAFDNRGASKDSPPQTLQVRTPPTISSIPDQTLPQGGVLGSVPFTVSDPDTDPNSLSIIAFASNASLVPTTSIFLGGSGTQRSLAIAPNASLGGSTFITLRVSDGTYTSSTSFTLNVLAQLTSPALTLTFDPDHTAATISATSHSGAKSVYTLNGTDPTPASPELPLRLTEPCVLKARMLSPDGSLSPITTITLQRTLPVSFTPDGHTPIDFFSGPGQIRMTAEPGATVSFRPTGETTWSTLPSGQTALLDGLGDGNHALEAHAIHPQKLRSTATLSQPFSFRLPPPSINRVYAPDQSSATITLSTKPGATIRWTANGTTPTHASPEYLFPIPITSTTRILAAAFQEGYIPSGPVSASVQTLPPPRLSTSAGLLTTDIVAENTMDLWITPDLGWENAYGETRTKTGWTPAFTLTTTDVPTPHVPAAFQTPATAVNQLDFAKTPITFGASYTLAGYFKTTTPSTTLYAGITSTDSNGDPILSEDINLINNPVTWLTEPLQPGQSIVRVAAPAAFNPLQPQPFFNFFAPLTNFPASHPIQLANQPTQVKDLAQFIHSIGWPTITSVNITAGTLQLDRPYTGSPNPLPAGTPVMKRRSGNTHQYELLANNTLPPGWQYRSKTFSTFRPGTVSVGRCLLMSFTPGVSAVTGFELWEGALSDRPKLHISLTGNPGVLQTPGTPGPVKLTLTGNHEGQLRLAQRGPNYLNSPILARTITFKTATPSITQPTPSSLITLACATVGARIHYTTDGTTPTEASSLYQTPLPPLSAGTLRARAFRTHFLPSNVAGDDADNDGLSDSWELNSFGSLVESAQSDPDGDGYSNLVELRAGTNPSTTFGFQIHTPLHR